MKLAILSDIHDHVWNLKVALAACADCDALICCGDLCSPFIIGLLANGYAGPIHIVFGNNDGDQFRIAQNASKHGDRVRLYGEFAVLSPEQAGIRVGVNHYPKLAAGLAASGEFDLVCYGHDHTLKVDIRADGCSLINPGAVMGYDPVAAQDNPATIVHFDTQTLTGHILDIRSPTTLPMWPIGREVAPVTLAEIASK